MSRERVDGGTLTIDETTLPIDVEVNPRARRLILRLGRERRVRVTCPSKRHIRDAIAMAHSRREWLAARLREQPHPIAFLPGAHLPVLEDRYEIVHTGRVRDAAWFEPGRIITGGPDARGIARRVETLLRQTALNAFEDDAHRLAARLDVDVSGVQVRQMSSRWGSCSPDGALTFNWKLIFAPRPVMFYVAAHEVAHLVHMDHSSAFWALVNRLDPDYQSAATWLRQRGAQLHAYGHPPDDETALPLAVDQVG